MGKLIVIDGLDGSGKNTQSKLLAKALEAEGKKVRLVSFPDYDSPACAPVKMYLSGEFGQDPDAVNSYAASTFFAVDRYASYKQDWGNWYENGGLVLSDRYTTSNAVHQASKQPAETRNEFLKWLYDLEYNRLGLPCPDLVIYLDVPTDFTRQLMRHREAVTNTTADIHEQDMDYLATCRQAGRAAADFYGWTIIECVRDGAMRSIEDIHAEIYNHVSKLLEE